MFNKIYLQPATASLVAVSLVTTLLPASGFASSLTLKPCAATSTEPFLKDGNGQPITPNDGARIETACYGANDQLVKRVMIYSATAPNHWSVHEESMSLTEKAVAQLRTPTGLAALTAGAVATAFFVPFLARRLADAHLPKFAVYDQPPAPESVAVSAGIAPVSDLNAVEDQLAEGPEPIPVAAVETAPVQDFVDRPVLAKPVDALNPLPLNRIAAADLADVPYAIDDMRVTLSVHPSQVAPWIHTYLHVPTGRRVVLQHTRAMDQTDFAPSPHFEAILVDEALAPMEARAPRGDWQIFKWSEAKYLKLADPGELRLHPRTEPAPTENVDVAATPHPEVDEARAAAPTSFKLPEEPNMPIATDPVAPTFREVSEGE